MKTVYRSAAWVFIFFCTRLHVSQQTTTDDEKTQFLAKEELKSQSFDTKEGVNQTDPSLEINKIEGTLNEEQKKDSKLHYNRLAIKQLPKLENQHTRNNDQWEEIKNLTLVMKIMNISNTAHRLNSIDSSVSQVWQSSSIHDFSLIPLSNSYQSSHIDLSHSSVSQVWQSSSTPDFSLVPLSNSYQSSQIDLSHSSASQVWQSSSTPDLSLVPLSNSYQSSQIDPSHSSVSQVWQSSSTPDFSLVPLSNSYQSSQIDLSHSSVSQVWQSSSTPDFSLVPLSNSYQSSQIDPFNSSQERKLLSSSNKISNADSKSDHCSISKKIDFSNEKSNTSTQFELLTSDDDGAGCCIYKLLVSKVKEARLIKVKIEGQFSKNSCLTDYIFFHIDTGHGPFCGNVNEEFEYKVTPAESAHFIHFKVCSTGQEDGQTRIGQIEVGSIVISE